MRKNIAVLVCTIIVLGFTVARTNMINDDLEVKLRIKDRCIEKHQEARISQEACEMTITCHLYTGKAMEVCLKESVEKIQRRRDLTI